MIFAFADFELDSARFELRRAGTRVALQPKVLRMLLHLVMHRERAVGDDELMRALWPSETVSRASIKRAVLGARTALGDHGQTAIRTVRGHGYQFAYPLRERSPVTPTSELIGREPVLAELMRSQGNCSLLFGAPGLGKTRLLHELAARAKVDVWWGRCLELEGAPAYWPLQQVLRALLESRDEAELRSILGPGLSDLAEGFPELALDGQPAPDIGSRRARFRLFDGLARSLLRATKDRPALILLDDLHRADEATLRFLSFLAGQLTPQLTIVATARHDARLAALASIARCITLGGLSQAEVARYLAARHQAAPQAVVTRLHEQTAGNPLFLEELLRVLRTREDASWSDLAQLATDVGLRGAIERHLSVLSAEARALVAQASVLGREFSLGMASQLTGADDTLAWLEQAARAEVLQRSGTRYRFQHALIRDVLYEGLDAVERARLHRRAGALLEAAGAEHGDELELIAMAEHFRLAAPLGELERALRYAKCASLRAAKRFAHEEAAAHLNKALALLDGGHVGERVALLLACGEAQSLAGATDDARDTLLRAAALARAQGDLDTCLQAARVLGRTRESGSFDEARVALLREVVGGLAPDDARAPGLVAMLAKSLSFGDARAERARLAREALSSCDRIDDPHARTEALLACHEALTEPESRAERQRIAAELRALAQQKPDARVQLAALITHFQNSLESADVHAMHATVVELSSLAQRVRDPLIRWYEHAYRTTCAVIAGRFADAFESARAALQLGKLVGEELSYHFYCVQVNGTLRMQGRLEEAQTMAEEMALRFPTLVGWRAWLGAIQADRGDVARARATLAQLLGQPIRDPYLLSALCPLAELCVRVGDHSAIESSYDALLPYRLDQGTVSFGGATYGPIALYLERMALQLGRFEAALQHGEHALSEAERMQSPPFVVLASLTLAVALHKSGGERARARGLAERAHELAQSIGLLAVLPLSGALVAGLAEQRLKLVEQ